MSKQYESMMEGLTELLEFAKGDKSKARVRVTQAADIQVKPLRHYSKEEIRNIRLKNNLTIKTFADCFGVSKKTVESWERGKNTPSGASIRLFQLLEKNTKMLEEYDIIQQQAAFPNNPKLHP